MTYPSSLPGLTRQSIPLEFQLVGAAEWMPGSRPGMTGVSQIQWLLVLGFVRK
jgi:hypothetical protein